MLVVLYKYFPSYLGNGSVKVGRFILRIVFQTFAVVLKCLQGNKNVQITQNQLEMNLQELYIAAAFTLACYCILIVQGVLHQ